MRYRIGEFSRLSGVTVKALRFYDQIGLLQPTTIDPRTRYRFYDSGQLQQMAAIVALKELGASLEDVKVLNAASEDVRQRRKLLEKLRSNAQRSLATAERSLRWIESALAESGESHHAVPVVLKRRAAVHVASVRARAGSYAEIGELERELHGTIEPNLAPRIQGVLWHRCAASGSIEGEPFIEMSRRASRCGPYELKELPSVTAAVAYCEAEDRAAERAFDAVSRWIALHQFRLDGPKREIYVGNLLEIQFPVRPM